MIVCLVLVLAIVTLGSGKVPGYKGNPTHANLPLDAKVERFDVADAILRDGISELSLKDIEGSQLGFEEIIRARIQDDPQDQGPHFSLHLQGKTVREVLNELCRSDGRYTWSDDGATINVYPLVLQSWAPRTLTP